MTDFSRRIISILREEAVDVEQYSIDEAFIFPPTTAAADYAAYGRRVRAKILRWVGIPCGVGFAPTKTLAKIANHIAKKRPDGVFLMPDDPTEILAALPVQEVWGVGRRLPLKLRAERILTAQHLRDAPVATIRSIGGVTLLRTAMELRGVLLREIRRRAFDVFNHVSFLSKVVQFEKSTSHIAPNRPLCFNAIREVHFPYCIKV